MTQGYARPTTGNLVDFDYFDVGLRGEHGRIEWRPVGSYEEAGVGFTWGQEPGGFAFTLNARSPLAAAITDVKRKCYHFRAGYNGMPFTGRIMQRRVTGKPGREKFLYSGVDNKIWLKRVYGWVNPLFPPEVQIGLTGKQDIVFGPVDAVFKHYLSRNATRLGIPLYAGLPLRWPEAWNQDDLYDFATSSDFFEYLLGGAITGGAIGSLFGGGLILGAIVGGVAGVAIAASERGLFDEIIALQARFTQMDELFKQTVDRMEMGVSVDLWDGWGASPTVFNTSGLSALQSIIDYSSDHFLQPSQLTKPINASMWFPTMPQAGYVFNTHLKRDRRKVQFRTDGTQIESYDMVETHADAYRAIVGGKSPDIVNKGIELGANLALTALFAGLSMIPGLGFLNGISVAVGDLFDDVFFAYQVFWDQDLADDIGPDALPEIFADNTAAWSMDSFTVGKTALADHGGKETIEIKTTSGGPDGRGISFGVDNGTPRRYRCGDILSFYDRGNVIEQYVSAVNITSKPGERMREQLTLGTDKRAKGPWDRLFEGIARGEGAMRGVANSV